jgi:hypothetical protein
MKLVSSLFTLFLTLPLFAQSESDLKVSQAGLDILAAKL